MLCKRVQGKRLQCRPCKRVVTGILFIASFLTRGVLGLNCKKASNKKVASDVPVRESSLHPFYCKLSYKMRPRTQL